VWSCFVQKVQSVVVFLSLLRIRLVILLFYLFIVYLYPCAVPGADLGFHKGGCPIHLKGAPEVERRRSNIFPAFYIFKYEAKT